MKVREIFSYKSAYKQAPVISKNLKSKASTGVSRDILQTFKLTQTFMIDINLIDYL